MNPKRILIADDEEHLGRLVKFKLESAGYEVDWRQNGKEAWEGIHGKKPDLVILDVMMPEMTGFEVLKRIRADEELVSIPVILLSAKGQQADVRAGMELGATEYITKPFRPAALLECVKRLLHDLPRA